MTPVAFHSPNTLYYSLLSVGETKIEQRIRHLTYSLGLLIALIAAPLWSSGVV